MSYDSVNDTALRFVIINATHHVGRNSFVYLFWVGQAEVVHDGGKLLDGLGETEIEHYLLSHRAVVSPLYRAQSAERKGKERPRLFLEACLFCNDNLEPLDVYMMALNHCYANRESTK